MIQEIRELRHALRETRDLLERRGIRSPADRTAVVASICKAALQFTNIALESDELPSPHRDEGERQRMHPVKQAYLRAQGAHLISAVGKLAQEKRLRAYSEDHDFIDSHYDPDFEPAPFEQDGSYGNYMSPGPNRVE